MDIGAAVIGGGVVGLGVAVELSKTRQVAVIERHGAVGLENSSHNSGVVHAGIYYPTGSLKHTLCLEGNRLMYQWCDERGVAAVRLGKLIIAVDESEVRELDAIADRAQANGVPGMTMLAERGRLQELEPEVTCVAALYSATTGVVDQVGLMSSYASAVEEAGGWIALKHEVTAIDRVAGGFVVTMIGPDGDEACVTSDVLVNSGGLAAPAIASMLGYVLDGTPRTPRLRQSINKGRYYDIVPSAKARLLRHLVYPVPEHATGGLGVHVTIDIAGLVHLGPDTEWLDEGAALDFRSDDRRREDFYRAANRYLPFLELEDLAPGQVGYRPKLQLPNGEMADFLIWHDRGYVHLGGIESPGLTASLAIGRRVARLL